MSINTDQGLPAKELATLLLENKMLDTGATNINDLIPTPEFQILKLLTNFAELNDSEIEAKYQAPHSLSMILSNLSADNLIEPTGSYKWRISDKLKDIINIHKKSTIKSIKEKEIESMDYKVKQEKMTKKSEFKRIVDALENSSYVPNYYSTIEELYSIGELELLVIIHQKQPISSEELEKLYTNQNSLSLTLSNLKADNLIKEDLNYNWILEDKFKEKISSIHKIIIKHSDENENSDEVQSLSSKINFIEHSQFIKLLLDMNYFKNLSLNQIIDTVEFKILNIIYSKSPVSAEEIEEELPDLPSLTMILSNLKIDGLCEQDNEYRWKLSSDFRRKMMKIRVSNEEFIEEIKLLDKISKASKKKVIEESVEEVTEEITTIEETEEYLPEVKSTPATPNDIIQDILIKYRYMKSKLSSMEALLDVPEFEILKVIIDADTISADEIENKTQTSSVSLTLSNLSADRLIVQTVDYKWTISDDLKKIINPSLVKSRQDTEFEEKEIERKQEEIKINEERERINNDNLKLAVACRKKGYINDENLKEEILNTIPEFEVLKIIYVYQPVSMEDIKTNATSVSPVLISRTISKLEADEVIENDVNRNYVFTDNFNNLIIEDEIKEQKEKERLETERLEQERYARLKALESQLSKISKILVNDGYINADSSDPKVLMKIPEFELIAILNKEGAMSIEELKQHAESVSPVLISRTISKLEADDLIVRASRNLLDISSNLKAKIHSAE